MLTEDLLAAMRDDLYNTALLANPMAFAMVADLASVRSFGSSTGASPVAAQALVENKSNAPVVALVAAESPNAGDSVTLILATEEARCTSAQASLVVAGSYPRAGVVLKPGDKLWGTVVTNTAVLVRASLVPFRGSSLVGVSKVPPKAPHC